MIVPRRDRLGLRLRRGLRRLLGLVLGEALLELLGPRLDLRHLRRLDALGVCLLQSGAAVERGELRYGHRDRLLGRRRQAWQDHRHEYHHPHEAPREYRQQTPPFPPPWTRPTRAVASPRLGATPGEGR